LHCVNNRQQEAAMPSRVGAIENNYYTHLHALDGMAAMPSL